MCRTMYNLTKVWETWNWQRSANPAKLAASDSKLSVCCTDSFCALCNYFSWRVEIHILLWIPCLSNSCLVVRRLVMLCRICLTEVLLYDGFIFEGMGANCLNCHHHCHLLRTTVSTYILGYLHISKETMCFVIYLAFYAKNIAHVCVFTLWQCVALLFIASLRFIFWMC